MNEKTKLLSVAVLAVNVLIFSTVALAQIHKWKDANGVTQYGDRPPQGVSNREIGMMPSGSINHAGECGNISLTSQETQMLERMDSDFWKRISPTELATLKRHPLWSHFLSTADALKLWRKYELSARGDFAQRFMKEKRNQPRTAWQNNPADINTANNLRAAEACKDKYDNEVVPAMIRRLDGSPFKKFFIPPSANRFEPPVSAPSAEDDR
jgi:hypothetical protein